MTLEYWHNPRCSKSRQGKDLLDAAGSKYTERRYVDDAPSAKELDRVLTALGKEPWDIARMGARTPRCHRHRQQKRPSVP